MKMFVNIATTNTGRQSKTKKQREHLMVLSVWGPSLIAISFGAHFASPHPPQGLGLRGFQAQVGMGLLGDSGFCQLSIKGWHILQCLFQHATAIKSFIFLCPTET